MGEASSIQCHRENDFPDQINGILNSSSNNEEKIVIAMQNLPDKKKTIEGIQNAVGIDLTTNYKKTHFSELCDLSQRYRHSNSSEFQELHSLQENISFQKRSTWPITPKENLEAQLGFIAAVCMYADNNINKNLSECLLQVKADYTERKILNDVVSAPPNVSLLKSGLFAIIRVQTEIGALLCKTENEAQEKADKQARFDLQKLKSEPIHYQQMGL